MKFGRSRIRARNLGVSSGWAAGLTRWSVLADGAEGGVPAGREGEALRRGDVVRRSVESRRLSLVFVTKLARDGDTAAGPP